MPKISTYQTVVPEGDDTIIISQVDGTPTDVTKNITVQSIVDLSINTGVPFAVNATAGGSSTYSSAINTILLNWTGGAGTYELTLPLASSVPYRIIRVISSGTIASADKVHLVGQGSDTVDGNAFYNLNKQYSGAQVWSSGTEWIVIQEKS
tara:strand:- start:1042 stop:1494 length:453 start_codon:yes stop_codon:yes gene_type:complete